MPCDSRIFTRIKSLAEAKAAAESLGLTAKLEGRYLTIGTGRTGLILYQGPYDEAVSVSGDEGRAQRETLQKVTVAYAEAKVKDYARKTGRTVTREPARPGTAARLVLTKR